MRDKIAPNDHPVAAQTLSGKRAAGGRRGRQTRGGEGRRKTPRYYANFTIQNLVCISMGHIHSCCAESRVREVFFEKSSSAATTRTTTTTPPVVASARGNWDAPARERVRLSSCMYFIDNAYRNPRWNKVPVRALREKVAGVFFVPADFIAHSAPG